MFSMMSPKIIIKSIFVIFSFSLIMQIVSGIHPAFYTIGNNDPFAGVKPPKPESGHLSSTST